MSQLVLDASVALSWCFEDEADEFGDRALARVVDEGAVVPPLWWLEVTNVFLVAERRGRITPADSARFLALLRQLPVEVAEAEPSAEDLLRAGRTHGLSSYDACYLLTATGSGLMLAARDQKLRGAAESEGVELFT